MKRSPRLRLVLMGSASVALVGCGEDPEPVGVFSSVAECLESGSYTQAQCAAALEQAKREHPRIAPRYASKEDCEADFGRGKCESPSSVAGGSSEPGSFWMPLMMGYLVGHVLGNLNSNNFGQPLYRPNVGGAWNKARRSWDNRHVYSPGSWRTANNTEVAQRAGLGMVERSALRSSLPTTVTITRGGFGSRAALVGTGG